MNNTQEVLNNLAQFFIKTAQQAIVEKGSFSVALSGGSSPKNLFTLLASEYKEAIDWSKVGFFYGDERYVLQNHPDYNGLMAREFLLSPLQINENQIFEVNTHIPPKLAATAYWESIQQYFNNKQVVFDLILLGLGDDAHTASLFPDTEALDEKEAKVVANFVPKLNTWRITFTYSLINQAKNIAFLTFGENKAEAVYQILKGARDPKKYPAQLIQGNVHWYLDAAAMDKLN